MSLNTNDLFLYFSAAFRAELAAIGQCLAARGTEPHQAVTALLAKLGFRHFFAASRACHFSIVLRHTEPFSTVQAELCILRKRNAAFRA